MKKKNKVVFKLPNLIIALVFILSMAINMMIPLTVNADDTITVVLTLNVADNSEVTLTARSNQTNVGVGVSGDELIGTRGESNSFIDFRDTADNSKISGSNISVVCSSTKSCQATLTVPSDHGVRVVTGGGTPFAFKLGGNDYNFANTNITTDQTLQIVDVNNTQTPFDGKAYLVWSCGNGTCYHLFEGLSNNPQFVQASTVTADNDGGETFDVHAEQKGFVLKDAFENWQNSYKTNNSLTDIDWTTIDAASILEPINKGDYEEDAIANHGCNPQDSEEDFHACVDEYVSDDLGLIGGIGLQPVGEPYSNNAYTSYGDRNFKITIYNEDYRGISLGDLSSLHYYPSAWADGLLRVESYDISGTTKTNPVDIDTVLLEPELNIEELSAYNSFEIDSIEALDVPTGAVTIADQNNGKYKITFSSHFYDKVVFKVTSTNQETYYFRVNRLTLNAPDEILYRSGQPSLDLSTDFYFDRETSYDDYVIKATIEYKDGTKKVVTMENSKHIDDGLGNITEYYEVDEENPPHGEPGKGLKKANYKYTFTNSEAKKVNKVYINVEKKGSTKSSYAGAFAGSGKGIVVNFREVD